MIKVLAAVLVGLAASPTRLSRGALVAQEVVISEFLAGNDSGITDEDGDRSDWIELYNPGVAGADIGGWFLTDDAGERAKWRIPPVVLAPGRYLIIFASGKDRAVPDGAFPGSELHTNFRLSRDPEYLALIRPDGRTVAHAYAPAYPRQYGDVSYGILEAASEPLITSSSPGRVLIPAGPGEGLAWTLVGFDDSAWSPAAPAVGFDADGPGGPPPAGRVNLALGGVASQSSEYGGFPAERAIDGDYADFTATSASDPEPRWELDLGRSAPLASIVLYNRGDGCCQSRLRDLTVSVLDSAAEVVFESPLLNPENSLGGGGTGGPASIGVDLPALAGGPVEGRFVQVARAPDPDLSGTGGQGDADEAIVLSLGELEVFEGSPGFGGLIRTDLEEMRGVNASAYLRIPFQVQDPGALEKLRLRIRYDAGFAAYLNGSEAARRNAPGAPGEAPAWNAAATAERDDAAALVFEEIDLTPSLQALRAGANLLAIHGLNSSAADGDFLLAVELEGLSAGARQLRYFQTPTPGAPNDPGGVIDFVADTRFSAGRGFFEAPVDVEITTATGGAQIRYTLDGTVPTAATGLAYMGPIRIGSTTVLRAAAFKTGYAPTNADTQTYLFLDDVLKQPVVLKDIVQHPVYGPLLKESLRAIPAVSLVPRSAINGIAEAETSVELIHPDGSQGFQIDAGVKKVGGHTLATYPKNNMRLYFRKRYGEGKLHYPLFKGQRYGDRTAREFDRLNLRGGAHDSVFYLGDGQQPPADAQYLRNRWIGDAQFEMGRPSINGRFVHLYIRGTYWGLYELMEWPSQQYLASYFGGGEEDYAATNSGRPTGDSDIGVWNQILARAGNYAEVRRLVDLPNFADYMVLNFYAGNAWDWRPNQNWMAGGPVLPDRGGFKFFCWDSDIIFRSTDDYNLDQGGPGNLFKGLLAHEEFRVLLADRIHKHFFNAGVLTPARVRDIYSYRAGQVRDALVAETARWRWNGRVWTRDNQWQKEIDRLRADFFPRRTAIVLDQFRRAGFYPRVEAPEFNRYDGAVPEGFRLSIIAPAGSIYYTADGSDPRLPGGGVSPGALQVGIAESVELIAPGARARVLVPTDGSLGLSWTQPDFDDSGWRSGPTGVGLEQSSGYENEIGTDIGAEALGKNASVYLRLEFNVADPAAFNSLILRMKYDDGFAAYLNGTLAASANAPENPLWNSTATAAHADNLAVVFQDFDLAAAAISLRPGKNVLAVQGMNVDAANGDLLITPALAASSAENGGLAIDAPVTVKARAKSGAQWSALTEAFFWFDIPLRITEIHYHPRPEDPPASYDADDFEFIELKNLGPEAIDLDGFRLGGGVEFDFSQGAARSLGPGEVILLASNVPAFRLRYGAAGLKVAGEYSGRLSNGGDFLRLEGLHGEPLLDFEYSDAWYPETDGEGYSLVIVDAGAPTGSWGEAASWKASAGIDGSPGRVETDSPAEGFQVPGDINQDARLDISDCVLLLGFLFLGEPKRLPCGGGTIAEEPNRLLLDSTGDAAVDLSDAIRILTYLFLADAPPARGAACTRIAGCQNACKP